MPSRLLRSAPYFPVADVAKLAAYYERTLGFHIDYTRRKPADVRDPQPRRLPAHAAPRGGSEPRDSEREAGRHVGRFYWVDDVEALCAELRGRGADVVYGPVVQSDYDMKEFAVRDPDGYVLGFGQEWKRA